MSLCFTPEQLNGTVPFIRVAQPKNKVPLGQIQTSNNLRIANILTNSKYGLNGGNVTYVTSCNNCNNGNNLAWQFHKYKN
jgi:hypothetical protein